MAQDAVDAQSEMYRSDADDVERELDLNEFTPRLLVYLSNIVSRVESRRMRARLDLSTGEWRVLSTLARTPDATSSDIAEFIGVTKGMVSRSVSVLRDRGLVRSEIGPRGSRPMRLTAAGSEAYRELLEIDREVEATLLEGVPPEEARHLNALLRGMISRVRIADLAEQEKEETDD